MHSFNNPILQVGTIVNGNAAFTTNTFKVYVGSESQTSGIFLTFVEDSFATTPTVSSASPVAAELTLFTFTMEPKDAIPAGGKIIIVMPDQITF